MQISYGRNTLICVYPLWKTPRTRKNPTCTAFEELEEVPETVSLDFLEDDIMQVASTLSGSAGALGVEAI